MGKTLFLNFKQKGFELGVLLIVQLGESAGFHLPEQHKLGVAYAPAPPKCAQRLGGGDKGPDCCRYEALLQKGRGWAGSGAKKGWMS